MTIEGKRFEVATHQHVKPSEWSPPAGKIKGRSETAIESNMKPGLIKKGVYDFKERIQIERR